jgi:3-oxoadipate enol-lactonase
MDTEVSRVRISLVVVLFTVFAADVDAQALKKGRTSSGIAYDVQGAGPFLVLLSGSNLDRRMWTREAGWLAKSHTVVRYDLRAHGESETATSPFSHLSDLKAVLDELEIEKASLIGLSAGATIALEAALEMPDRVERMVLAGPAIGGFVGKARPSFPPELFQAMQARDWRRVSEILLGTTVFEAPAESQALVRQMVTENERLWTVDRALMKPPLDAAARLGAVRTPTLVIVGEKDTAQLEHAELLAAKIPGARLVRVPGGGHLVNLTSPQAFDAAVSAFLARR